MKWKLCYTKNTGSFVYKEYFVNFSELMEFVTKYHYTDEVNFFTNYWCELVKEKKGLFG